MTAFDQAFALLKDFTFNPPEGYEDAHGTSPFPNIISRDWVYSEPMSPFDSDRIQETAENEVLWRNASGDVPSVNLANEHWRDFDPDNEQNMADLIYTLEHEHLHNTPTMSAGVALDGTDLLQQWAEEFGRDAWFGPDAEGTDEELDEEHRDWLGEREHEAMWRLQGDRP